MHFNEDGLKPLRAPDFHEWLLKKRKSVHHEMRIKANLQKQLMENAHVEPAYEFHRESVSPGAITLSLIGFVSAALNDS
jgi:adenine C2-methylase RlmN of 23S rRNA A2503 and tRNA A37